MASVSTNIRIDSKLKKESSELLQGLGLSLSEAVNVFLHQVVLQNGLPFEVKYQDTQAALRKETILAIQEAQKIAHDPTVKSYTDMNEMFKDLDN